MGRSGREERGVVAIEFALVVPILLMVLLGTTTTALAYSDHLAITNAAREGARYGASADVSNSQWGTSVRNQVKDVYLNAGSTLEDNQICAKVVDAAGTAVGTPWVGTDCGAAPASPTSMATGSCAVLVWIRKPAKIDLVTAPSLDFHLGADAVSYYGRTVSPCTASN